MPGDDGRNKHPPRRSLVTGGAGFIGRHLVELLLNRGHQVRILDLAPTTGLDGRAEFVRGSILDRPLLRDAMDGTGWVFHLAADPNLWAPDPDSFRITNHEGTRAVLEEAERCGAERIVHTSTESILVGARNRQALLDESANPAPDEVFGHYCRSKLLAEQAARAAARRGLPVVIVNPTMPIGAGDHRMTQPTQMILDFLNGANPAYLEFEMNLVPVADAALGHLLAVERGRTGERYILGGANIWLSQVLAILEELTGLPMPRLRIPYFTAFAVAALSELIADRLTHRAPRASLSGVRLARHGMQVDSGKAVSELGYRQTPLRDALAGAVAWLAQQNKVRRPLPKAILTLQDA